VLDATQAQRGGVDIMELRHLRYFVAIAEEGSVTRAAERLWIAQPGLSAQMRHLEAELGVQLLERHSRGIRLTQAGEVFLERARVALAAADAAAATGGDLQAGLIGSLRLGVASGPAWPLMPEVLQRFSSERSGVELSVVQGYGGALSRDLRDGRLDALLAPIGSDKAGMKALGLGSAEWVVLLGTGHPLAGIGPLAAAALDGERVAVTGHRDGGAFDGAVVDVLTELGVTPEPVPAPWPALPAAIRGNDLVALTTAPDALPAGVLARRLDPRRTLSFELLWRDEVPSPALTGFVDTAAAYAERQPAPRRLAAVA
jgi:DNA-binding transcriptional LysR family regulator